MKLTLKNGTSFWGLCHPIDIEKMLIWLNDEDPSAEVIFDDLPVWAQATIKNSIIAKRIEADPMPDMEQGKIIEEEKKEVIVEQTKKKTKKSPVKKKTKKKITKKKAKNKDVGGTVK